MSSKNWEQELTEENLLEEIAKAKEAWQEADTTEFRAISVKYDQEQNLIVIYLRNGSIFSFPPEIAQGLTKASPQELADMWIPPDGSSIHWETLDVDFGIPSLVGGIFGTKSWMDKLEKK